MLAVGNICLTWEAPGVITLHLEVFLVVEGRGPFRGYLDQPHLGLSSATTQPLTIRRSKPWPFILRNIDLIQTKMNYIGECWPSVCTAGTKSFASVKCRMLAYTQSPLREWERQFYRVFRNQQCVFVCRSDGCLQHCRHSQTLTSPIKSMYS